MTDGRQDTLTGNDIKDGIDLSKGTLRAIGDGQWCLRGSACRACGLKAFPPVPVCSACMGEEIAEIDLPNAGILYSWSTLHVGPAHWFKPFTVGYVDLPGDVRVMGRIEGEPRFAAPVTLAQAVIGRTDDGAPIRSFVFRTEEA